ncbi:MAG TPA: GNAT family protein [Acidimicrobiales bacterium]|nr:GNAT family protein [Acidimicrobiales bacterium]
MSGRQVVLRRPVVTDREVRRAIGRHEEIQRMYGVAVPRTAAMTESEAERWFQSLGADGSVEWVIEADSRLAGTARLHSFDAQKSAKYAIGLFEPSRLGQGLGTEATALIVGYAFDELGLEHVHLDVLEFNVRAIRCYTSVGFRVMGRKPSNVVIDGDAFDDIVMAIAEANFRARRAK